MANGSLSSKYISVAVDIQVEIFRFFLEEQQGGVLFLYIGVRLFFFKKKEGEFTVYLAGDLMVCKKNRLNSIHMYNLE